MDSYILDTNLFFNMEAGLNLGNKTDEVVFSVTQAIKKLKKEATFYMPPRIVDEFLSFFDNQEQPFIKEFLAEVTIKTPDANKLDIPAPIFYKLVEDIRTRSYRGLTVAEEEIQKAAQIMAGTGQVDKKDFQMKVGPVVKTFRDRYRQATRTGFLDSVADLDLIMLAKETAGYLISSDEGVVTWGRTFGVKEMPVPAFGERLRALLHHQA